MKIMIRKSIISRRQVYKTSSGKRVEAIFKRNLYPEYIQILYCIYDNIIFIKISDQK